MALQDTLGGMVRQGDFAVRAGEGMSAFRTDEEGMKTPTVEKKEGLFPRCQGFTDRLDERAGEQRREPLFVPLRAEIDHLDVGEGPIVDPRGEGQVAVTPFGGVMITLDRRRGGSEDYRRPREPAPHQGKVAGVVPEPFVLFVRGVMLFVHDDQTEVTHRRKEGRPGADDHPDLPPPDPLPLIVPDAPGDAAVDDRDLPLRKPAADAREELRRKGDLRDEVNRAAAAPEDLRDSPEVYLRLAASRHPVEKAGGEDPRGEAAADLFQRGSLRLVQRDVAFSRLRFQPQGRIRGRSPSRRGG